MPSRADSQRAGVFGPHGARAKARAGARPFVDGLVLAGGRSSRFGADKRLAKLGGQELVRRAVRVVAAVVPGTVFVATGRRAERLPGTATAVCIADAPPGLGPLGGIAAGLLRSRAAGLLVLGCDLPFVRPDTLLRLMRVGWESGRPAALRGRNGWEPLIAYWPRTLYNQVQAALWERRLAPHELLERLGAIAIGADPAELRNLNTRADFERAQSSR